MSQLFGDTNNAGSAIGSAILGGASAALGSPTTNTTQKINQNTQTSGNQLQQGYTTPNYDPATLALRNQLMTAYGNSIQGDTDLSGYQAAGQSQINQNADAQTQAISNGLAARGLSYSPIAAIAPAMSNQSRIAQQSQFQNSIPLLQQQLMQQKLAAASGFLKGLPVGTDTSQYNQNAQGVQVNADNTTTSGSKASAGSALGAGLGILAGLI